MKSNNLIFVLFSVAFMSRAALGADGAIAPETQPATQVATQAATQSSTQAAKQPRPSEVAVLAANSIVRTDLPYVDNASPKQTLDLYAPKNIKNAPVIIYVHGGEWARVDKSAVSFKPRFFNENGIVFISINYRLSNTDKHPAQVNDIAQAIRWTKNHVAEFNGDPNNILLVGHSAGCHLVALVGLDPRPLATVGLKPTDLVGIVSWSGGAFDLPAMVKEGGMYAGFIKTNFGENNEAQWRDASPINHIHDTTIKPPFLFVSAGDGNTSSRLISDEMSSQINLFGGHARSVVLPGKTHFTSDYDIGKPADPTGAILLEFLDYSRVAPAPPK